MTPEELQFRTLRRLHQKPDINQRELARDLGLSLGKTHYCVQALVQKGWIKMQNFRRSDNKLSYLYLITPSGLANKAQLTVEFLQRKQAEYQELEQEIAQLRQETEQSAQDLAVELAPGQ